MSGQGGGVDYVKARRFFLMAADKKNTVALYNLGHLYHYGLAVKQDDVKAAEWYRKAVDLGSMSAKNSLALFYSQGLGNLPVDKAQALKLLKSSACQGYAVAQNNLGLLYENGTDEIEKNIQQAYAWFSVSYYNGVKKANDSRRLIASRMKKYEIKQAEILAIEYIRKYPSPVNGLDTNKSETQCPLSMKMGND